MPIELESVVFRTVDPGRAAAFWGAVLDRPLLRNADGVLLAGSGSQVGLRFAESPPGVDLTSHLHVHLSEGVHDQSEWIATCESLGGRLRGNGHVPERSYAAMVDPAGEEFCVIEDGNTYLEGCGPLGEVTCAGTRAVGHFWSRALGWPLVWEVDEETAIQSPAGGTKISWGGEPLEPTMRRDRQFFSLTVPALEMEAEVERLLGLGASRRDSLFSTTLSDPDGVDFELRSVANSSGVRGKSPLSRGMI